MAAESLQPRHVCTYCRAPSVPTQPVREKPPLRGRNHTSHNGRRVVGELHTPHKGRRARHRHRPPPPPAGTISHRPTGHHQGDRPPHERRVGAAAHVAQAVVVAQLRRRLDHRWRVRARLVAGAELAVLVPARRGTRGRPHATREWWAPRPNPRCGSEGPSVGPHPAGVCTVRGERQRHQPHVKTLPQSTTAAMCRSPQLKSMIRIGNTFCACGVHTAQHTLPPTARRSRHCHRRYRVATTATSVAQHRRPPLPPPPAATATTVAGAPPRSTRAAWRASRGIWAARHA
eukprot:5023448-Prymnesium_polylepis.2